MRNTLVLILESFLIIPLFLPFSSSHGSSNRPLEYGSQIIKNFSSKDYNLHSEIWCILQDNRGLMYFGTNEGVLEYDGNTWRLIRLPNNSGIRSLCLDENGRIYVTGSSDFGYLAPDAKGQLRFVSLLKYMESDTVTFGEVWDVVAVSSGIFFKTHDKVFHWDRRRVSIIDSVDSFRLYTIDDAVYARDDGHGLVQIDGDSTRLMPNGATFSDIGVYNMLPFDGQILVTTSQHGLFLHDGQRFSRFTGPIHSFLVENQIYNTRQLPDGNFAVATRRGGAAIFSRDGAPLGKFNTTNGLTTNAVFDVYPDNQGGLWLATNEGITRIEISSLFSIISKKNTGRGYVEELYRFKDELFAANVYGIFYLDQALKEFRPVAGVTSSGNNFVSVGSSLFASSINMIATINRHHKAHTLFNFNNATLYQSVIDSSVIYAVDREGMAVLKHHDGNLSLVRPTIPFAQELSSLVEDKDGSVWIVTYYEGIIHLQSSAGSLFSDVDASQHSIDLYNKDNGLPGSRLRAFSVAGKVRFATDAGLFSFENDSKMFIPDSILGKAFTNSSHTILSLKKDHRGDLWILADTPNGKELGKAISRGNEMYAWQPTAAMRRLDLTTIWTIYPDYNPKTNNKCLWISTEEGLIRYDPGKEPISGNAFATFVRRVDINQDSLIFAGAPPTGTPTSTILSPETDNISFQFSASSYDKPKATQYQYRLEGNDAEWSHWSSEPRKEYTNLPSGDYTFRLRSRNVYGVAGSEDRFSFTILPPWYLSWWAYSFYALLSLAFLWQARHWELKSVHKKHALQLKLVELAKLKELDQLKSQFYANISHEFRTPLTLILGQTESVMSSSVSTQEKGKLQIANRNARRLLTLINQLLDLSKLEAGGMELKAEQHNLVSFLKSLFYSFESLAQSKNIKMAFEADKEIIPVFFEPDKMEKIFYNLLSNAFKFTPEHGRINVCVKIKGSSRVKITVKDTGRGIRTEQIPHIFNRFYQADTSVTREYKGTGIGLSLTKELVELHDGTISVESKEDEGSTFTVLLPLSGGLAADETVVDLSIGQYRLTKKANGSQPTEMENEVKNTDQLKHKKEEIILVVEDNEDVRGYIKEQLIEDYQIIEARNGEEGILKAQQQIPDLVITDVMMPKKDGYQLTQEMSRNEKTSHIPIIMLTAKASLDDKIEGLETGVDAYLTKPFNARELQARVKNLIYQRRELRKRFSKATVIKPSEVSTASIDQQFLEKAVGIIEASFEDEDFSVEALAEKLYMSVSQLNRKLHALIDQPAGQLIRSLRLQRAADLLKRNAGTIAEICYQVGFNDQGYFARAFKKQFECSPSKYKKQHSDS